MIEPITGRYAHIALDARLHRIYYEEAGEGIPLLCLHTAGSDGRQYRAVLNDATIRQHWKVVAFDMPWHGKSLPPSDFYLMEDGAARIQEGDRFNWLNINIANGTSPVYFDDLELVEVLK